MNIAELQAAMTAADNAYVEKTGRQPYLGTQLSLDQNDEGWEAYIYERDHAGSMGKRFSVSSGVEPEDAISALMDAIASLPSQEEANLREFQADLGRLIDKGRDFGIDVAYVNPLVETSKQLAENALTYQPTVAEE